MTWEKPWPTSPSTFSAGTRTWSKCAAPRATALVPMSEYGSLVTPGWFRSTTNAVMPRPRPSSLVRAKTTAPLAGPSRDIDLAPVITQSLPTVLLGSQAGVARVGAGVRFGQADPDDALAAGDLRDPVRGDLGSGVLREDLADQRADHLQVADVEVAGGDLLQQHAGGQPGHSLPAELLGDLGRDETLRAHLQPDLLLDPPGLLPLLVAGGQRLPGVLAGRIHQGLLLGGE